MFARLALIACGLCVLPPAIATEPAPTARSICQQSLPLIRQTWRHHLYEAPPAVAAVMVEAVDGELPQVRQGLAALPVAEQAHWRQVAMMTAASTYQPAVVEGLLDDGAAVNDPVRLPPLEAAFFHESIDAMDEDARAGAPASVNAVQSVGMADNRGSLVGPALTLAVECGDAATLDVLLRHHVDVMARRAPDVADALTAAVINGDAAIAKRLLDHGADVCAEDRHFKPGITLAAIGRRDHLPDALVRRLTCHAPIAADH